MRLTHRLVALVPVLVVSGCSTQDMISPVSPVSPVSPDDGGGPDLALTPGSEFDPWDGSVGLFGPCTADHQCQYAPGAQCLTTYPGGLCSVRCDPDGQDCGLSGDCIENVCLPACARTNNCLAIGGMCAQDTYCAPSCGVGAPPCSAGTVCDPYSVACTTPPTTAGADNGAPCTSEDQCRGSCVSEEATDVLPAGGYLGGMCVSNARAPDRGAFVDGGPLPRSNCPPGSVIAPPINASGDLALCLPECHEDGDCRPGYACWKTDGTNTYSDGYCAPINCADGVHQCPAPSACVADSGACAP
jgi:hypothetical protein